MFGYVTVYKPELKFKEYDAYKGVYCTLCKTMQSKYGFFSRFILSYDATFYVIYRMGVTDKCTEASKSHCSFSPCKKCLNIDSDKDIFEKAAAISVILSYFKLCDNISDGSFFERTACRIIKPYFSHICKKAQKKFPDAFYSVEKFMEMQAEAEKNFQSLDSAADPMGNMLGYILSDGNENSPDFKVGYYLGRTVYLLDAFDDYESDLKSNSFNPFKNTDNIIDSANLTVNLTVGELAEYIKQVKFYRFNSIIYNVIFEGLPYNLKRITEKARGEKDE